MVFTRDLYKFNESQIIHVLTLAISNLFKRNEDEGHINFTIKIKLIIF